MKNWILIVFVLLSSAAFALEENISFAILNVKDARNLTSDPLEGLRSSLISSGKGLHIHLMMDTDSSISIQLPNEKSITWTRFIQLASKLKEEKQLHTTPLIINTEAINPHFFFENVEHINKGIKSKMNKYELSTSFEKGKLAFIWDTEQLETHYNQVISTQGFVTKTYNNDNFNNKAKYIWINEVLEGNGINDNLTMLLPIIKEWEKYAKFPIFISTNNPQLRYNTSYQALKTINNVKGKIETTDSSLHTIYWGGDKYKLSSTDFNFPLDANTLLKPSSPGYRFIPSEVKVTDKHSNIEFQAQKIPLYSGLNAYYDCRDKLCDVTKRSPIKNVFGTKIIQDIKRGNIMSLRRGDFIELPSVKHFGFKNNSFTIAVWVKYKKELNGDNYTPIICSDQTTFRKGLQVAIRDGKAYAGFWHADIYGEIDIPEEEWTHIVTRYDHIAQRMTIFVNGEEDVTVAPYYPFLGDGKLFIGRVSGHNYGFDGQLDDVMIWGRAISDNDVETVYSTDLHDVPVSKRKYILSSLLVFILIISLFIWIKIARGKREKQGLIIKEKNNKQYKCYIYLIGEFQIINKDGIDIGKSLSPRLKSMFILILIYSIRESGITPAQLREELWKDFSKMKGQNAQRVTLSRLKNTLKSVDGLEVNTSNEKWTIDFNPNSIWVDFKNLWEIWLNNPEHHVDDLLKLLKRGVFIQEFQEPWADKQKGIFSNRYYDFLISTLQNSEINTDLRKNIADIVVIDEPLNEIALQVKLRYYTEKGRSHMAKQEYDSYCKQYKHLYDEEFKVSFMSLIKMS